jgi:hypothetical protein
MNKTDLETMLTAYIECALWSSTEVDAEGNMGRPLDENYDRDDILKATLREMRRECKAFGQANAIDIDGNWKQAGHDFWLTRNRHGAGFWDGDWPSEAGKRLTDAAHAYGSVDLYVHRGRVRAQ